jgi:GT2 family glycosyltransferase/SAM-dependent methyltransferase/glycosyltransferase involved in cell wall biosynthesis
VSGFLERTSQRAARPGRRTGAPRLIDWTGERFVPWAPDVQVAYEHYHRYLWAAQLVPDQRVLDLASGEGFGSSILAATAKSVTGIDIDEDSVAHARLNYATANLDFRVGSALDLSGLEAGSFDVVVAFEMVEHVADHQRLLAEIDRVLAPSGLLVLSTPDRRLYTDGHGQANPYHVHELDEPEFRTLLGERFDHVVLWGQRVTTGSRIAALDDSAPNRAHAVFLERSGEGWRESAEGPPLYLIGVASHEGFEPPPAESNLADYDLELMRTYEREAQAAQGRAEAEHADAEDHKRMLTETRELVLARDRALDERAGAHAAELHRMTAELARSRQEVEAAQADAAATRAQLQRYDSSVSWRAFQKARGKLYGRIGERSLLGRAVSGSLRAVGGARDRRKAELPRPPAPVIRFPSYDEPVASLVIPVHAQAELTAACLRSIVRNTEQPTYEVVLVDDTADDDTKHLLRSVENAQILVNEENLGYLRSMNRGVAAARGRHVVLFNNDTEVQPGWLHALVARAESADDIGAVTPKLVYPDGTLQEAGGIVFRDGDAWNYGKGHSADHPEYNFVRDVDYGSGAALLVRKDLFEAVGGYDERYAPIYYEDTDLSFALRERGYRTVYEPTATVIHVEGATSGTSTSSGSKRHQALNQPKFVAKWQTQLAAQPWKAPEQIRRLANHWRTGPHVLVIDHRVPTPDQDSGSLRMLRLLEALDSQGCRITFLPDNLATYEPYTGRLRSMGVEVLDGPINLWQELVAIGPQLRLVIASRPYVAARYLHMLREHAPGATIAYDTVDLHHLRESRRGAIGEDGAAAGVAATMRELELGLMRGTDVTLVVTEEERAYVERDLPGTRVAVVPNAHEVVAEVAPLEGRSGLLFVGGFEHLPNIDAVQYLVRSILPLVRRRLGDVPVTIVGSKAPPAVLELVAAGVEVAGYVPDLETLLDRTRVMVAPLRYGAGMKGKVTQSLAHGLPVVTTTVGAEGLGAVDGRDMLIADDPEAFADAIVRAYSDDALWRTLSENGQAVVDRVCSIRTMHERMADLLAIAAG